MVISLEVENVVEPQLYVSFKYRRHFIEVSVEDLLSLQINALSD